MVFSDTTNKNGLVQECEYWTGLGDAAISGDTTLIKFFTNRINMAFDRLVPRLLPYLKTLGWDDANTATTPTKTTNIVNGTNAYTFTTDGTNDILVITAVAILPNAAATQYTFLEDSQTLLDDEEIAEYISPNSLQTGVPSKYVVNGSVVYFDVLPNYSATNGLKIFFSREQYRFTTADTTKEPGFPVPFHNLLALYASKDYLARNEQNGGTLLSILNAEITKRELELEDFVRARNPAHQRMKANVENDR